MAPCTSITHSVVFQWTDRIHIKTHPAFRMYAVSPSPLLPFLPCYFLKLEILMLTLSWGLRLFSLVTSPAFLWFVKCLAYHQSFTDLVDVFCQSLHFKVRQQRFLKEMYYHWPWKFPVLGSKARLFSNAVGFPCCLQWNYFTWSNACFISPVHGWSSICYRWELQTKSVTFQGLQRAVN